MDRPPLVKTRSKSFALGFETSYDTLISKPAFLSVAKSSNDYDRSSLYDQENRPMLLNRATADKPSILKQFTECVPQSLRPGSIDLRPIDQPTRLSVVSGGAYDTRQSIPLQSPRLSSSFGNQPSTSFTTSSHHPAIPPAPAPPGVIYWPHTLRKATAVDEEIELATSCIRDCLRTFTVRTAHLIRAFNDQKQPSGGEKTGSTESKPISISSALTRDLSVSKDTHLEIPSYDFQEISRNNEEDKLNLIKQIESLQDERNLLVKNLEKVTSESARPTVELAEFLNQQEFFEEENRQLKAELKRLQAEFENQKSTIAELEKVRSLSTNFQVHSDKNIHHGEIVKIGEFRKTAKCVAQEISIDMKALLVSNEGSSDEDFNALRKSAKTRN